MVKYWDVEEFGGYPFGLVGDEGLLEINGPNTAPHIGFLRTGKPDGKYQWQILAQMACSGRKWCGFVSFDDRLPAELQYKCIRFERDDNKIQEMEQQIVVFLAELAQIENEMTAMMVKS